MTDLQAVLSGPAEEVAVRLLGSHLIRTINSQTVVCRIVETEAYSQTDAASHSYRGQTPRTAVMFGPAGRLYVYFTYGMHYCCNVVTGPVGEGAAVLIRAVEPLSGAIAELVQRRGGRQGIELTNGPAKLCQALAIDRECNGHDLRYSPVQLALQPALTAATVEQTVRIGITQATDVPWRFYIRGNSYVSK